MSFTKSFSTTNHGRKTARKNRIVTRLRSAPATVTTTPTAQTLVHSIIDKEWVNDNDGPVAISGITAANPGVVTTATAHGLATGDFIYTKGIAGMKEANYTHYQVTVLTATTFELMTVAGVDVDTSGYTAYSSVGTIVKVTGWGTGGAPESSTSIPTNGLQGGSVWCHNKGAASVTLQVYANSSSCEPVPFNSSTYAANDWVVSGNATPITADTQMSTQSYLGQGASAWDWIAIVLTCGTTSANVSCRINSRE